MVAKTTSKKKTKKKVKKELSDSLKENNDSKEPGIDPAADAITDRLEAVRIVQRYKEVIKSQNKIMIGYVGKQGQLFKKLRETEQFLENVGQSKPRVCFKIELYKYLKKYFTLIKSTLSSNYWQKNFKIVKEVCKNKVNFFSRARDE